jgi:hypothetical protein
MSGSSTGGGSKFTKAEILAAFERNGITDLAGLATHIESVAKPQGVGSEHTLVTAKGWILQILER